MTADRTTLFDESGAVLEFVEGRRDDLPIADLVAVAAGRSRQAAADAAVGQLGGWLLATDDLRLAAALTEAGCTEHRHSFVMQCALDEHVGALFDDPRFRLVGLPVSPDPALWSPILPSWRAAFPPAHPDHFAGDDRASIDFIQRIVDGTTMGPMHRSTTLLADRSGTPVAGIMVNVRDREPPLGGPWIADIWRDPTLRGSGVGSAMIAHAQRLLVEDGFDSLCLAVTAGNDARRTYERAGFDVVIEAMTLLIPPDVDCRRTLPRRRRPDRSHPATRPRWSRRRPLGRLFATIWVASRSGGAGVPLQVQVAAAPTPDDQGNRAHHGHRDHGQHDRRHAAPGDDGALGPDQRAVRGAQHRVGAVERVAHLVELQAQVGHPLVPGLDDLQESHVRSFP